MDSPFFFGFFRFESVNQLTVLIMIWTMKSCYQIINDSVVWKHLHLKRPLFNVNYNNEKVQKMEIKHNKKKKNSQEKWKKKNW